MTPTMDRLADQLPTSNATDGSELYDPAAKTFRVPPTAKAISGSWSEEEAARQSVESVGNPFDGGRAQMIARLHAAWRTNRRNAPSSANAPIELEGQIRVWGPRGPANRLARRATRARAPRRSPRARVRTSRARAQDGPAPPGEGGPDVDRGQP